MTEKGGGKELGSIFLLSLVGGFFMAAARTLDDYIQEYEERREEEDARRADLSLEGQEV